MIDKRKKQIRKAKESKRLVVLRRVIEHRIHVYISCSVLSKVRFKLKRKKGEKASM